MLTVPARKMALQQIAEEIRVCGECKANSFGLPVPGEGSPQAKIMVIGEAPGIEESRTGRPFVGRSGKFLTKLLNAVGLKKSAIFVTSPVKYYPGKRALKLREIRHGATHTQKQIEVIIPKVVILLGNVAIKAVLNEKLKVSDVHGRILQKGGITVIPTFHPSAAMRFPTIRAKMRRDFATIHRYLSENLR